MLTRYSAYYERVGNAFCDPHFTLRVIFYISTRHASYALDRSSRKFMANDHGLKIPLYFEICNADVHLMEHEMV